MNNRPTCLPLDSWRNRMNQIKLDENKFYTLAETVELVQTTLDAVKEKSDKSELKYSTTDVYWVIHDMLRYINRNVQGEFSLRRKEKGTYRITYTTQESGQQKAKNKLKSDVQQTADYLENLTGRRPPWG